MRRLVGNLIWAEWFEEDVVERETMRVERSGDETFRDARGSKAQGAAEVVVEDPDERALRLRTLRDQIDSGQYRIPAEAVADKVIRQMRRADVAVDEPLKTVARRVTGRETRPEFAGKDSGSRKPEPTKARDTDH